MKQLSNLVATKNHHIPLLIISLLLGVGIFSVTYGIKITTLPNSQYGWHVENSSPNPLTLQLPYPSSNGSSSATPPTFTIIIANDTPYQQTPGTLFELPPHTNALITVTPYQHELWHDSELTISTQTEDTAALKDLTATPLADSTTLMPPEAETTAIIQEELPLDRQQLLAQEEQLKLHIAKLQEKLTALKLNKHIITNIVHRQQQQEEKQKKIAKIKSAQKTYKQIKTQLTTNITKLDYEITDLTQNEEELHQQLVALENLTTELENNGAKAIEYIIDAYSRMKDSLKKECAQEIFKITNMYITAHTDRTRIERELYEQQLIRVREELAELREQRNSLARELATLSPPPPLPARYNPYDLNNALPNSTENSDALPNILLSSLPLHCNTKKR